MEKVVLSWLLSYVKDKLDPDQLGGIKGNSISHYLIEVTNFILYNQDLSNPQASFAAFINFAQGFNRIKHSKIIEILSSMSVPGWLLKVMMGYLTNRKLRVRFKNKVSSEKSLNSGAGQGCILGLWCFLLLLNNAGPAPEEIPIGEVITKPLKQRKPIKTMKKKWVDDMVVLASFDLKKVLERVNESEVKRPLTFHERTEHTLSEENNVLLPHMRSLQIYAKSHFMKINQKKTKISLQSP